MTHLPPRADARQPRRSRRAATLCCPTAVERQDLPFPPLADTGRDWLKRLGTGSSRGLACSPTHRFDHAPRDVGGRALFHFGWSADGLNSCSPPDPIGADRRLPRRRHQPCRELVRRGALYVVMPLQVQLDHVISIDQRGIALDDDLERPLVLKAEPGAAIRQRIGWDRRRGIERLGDDKPGARWV